MILDAFNLFSNAQAITVDAASTNIIDTQPQVDTGFTTTSRGVQILRDVGVGQFLKVFCVVTETFATTVSMIISLQTDADVAFGSPVTLWTTPAIPVATLVVRYTPKLPAVTANAERYLRLFYDISTTATAGKVTAGLVLMDQNNPTR